MNDLYWDGEPDVERLRHAYDLIKTDPARALIDLKDLAARGSAMSMVYLADAYRLGIGTIIDSAESDRWYRRAAEAGSVLASYHLGRRYLEQKEYPAALREFESGADKGYMPSIHQIGRMYAKGLGVEKDIAKARRYLEQSASQGYVFATRDLSSLLMSGAFGVRARVLGLWLFVRGTTGLIKELFRDPTHERLR